MCSYSERAALLISAFGHIGWLPSYPGVHYRLAEAYRVDAFGVSISVSFPQASSVVFARSGVTISRRALLLISLATIAIIAS